MKHVFGFKTAKAAEKALASARTQFPKARPSVQVFGKQHCLMVSATVLDSTVLAIRNLVA